MGAKIGSWGSGQAPQVLQPEVLTVVFDFEDVAQLKEIRIYLVNHGVNPLTDAILEGSNDGGDTWWEIDRSDVVTAFGSLDGNKSVGNLFLTPLFYDRLRFQVKSDLGTTIGKFITQNDIDI